MSSVTGCCIPADHNIHPSFLLRLSDLCYITRLVALPHTDARLVGPMIRRQAHLLVLRSCVPVKQG